jgi:hypothetical protein
VPRLTLQPAAGSGTARYAAYAALALAVLGLPLIGISDSECGFVGSATQDYSGEITEPGRTGGMLAFTLAPLLAIAALVLLVRAGRTGSPASRLAFTAAILVFPLAVLNFIFWIATAAFACGFF